MLEAVAFDFTNGGKFECLGGQLGLDLEAFESIGVQTGGQLIWVSYVEKGCFLALCLWFSERIYICMSIRNLGRDNK